MDEIKAAVFNSNSNNKDNSDQPATAAKDNILVAISNCKDLETRNSHPYVQ